MSAPAPEASPPGGPVPGAHRPRFLGRTDPDWWGADLEPPPHLVESPRCGLTAGASPEETPGPRESRRAA